MGKPSAPESPDIDALVQAAEDAAQMSYDLGQEQLAWAQETYAHDSAITDQVTNSFLETTDFALQQAEDTQARWEEQYQPVEDQMIAQAEQFATPEYKQQEMGRAAATTAQQLAEAQQASTRELQSYGVNPSAGKQLSATTATNTLGGAATAAAANQAAEAVDAKSLALTSDVANMGRGYPAVSTAELSSATQAGQGASQATTSATQTASNAMTAPSAYINAGTSALDVWGTTVEQDYANQINAYNAQLQASSGIGSAIGTLAGAAMPLIPGYNAATIIPTQHEGGPIQAQEGGAIPVAASPSRGAVQDDVPIMAESGEFVIPRKAVEWFGQKFFHDQIAKADKQKAETAQQRGQQAAVPAGTPASVPGPFPRTPQPTPAVNPARSRTGLGSPPVIGPRSGVAPSVQTMAAGGAVAHYLPPGQPMRPPVRRPPVMRGPAPRIIAPGPPPLSPTASPMVRSIRGMAAGGTVAPEWVWDAGRAKWVHPGPGDARSMDASATLANARGTSAALPVAWAPVDSASASARSMDASSLAGARVANARQPVLPPSSPDFGMSGSAYAGGGAGYGASGARGYPVTVQPPGSMAYAPPPPGIFPYSRTPPPYGVGQEFGMGAPPPYGVGQSTMGAPPPYGVGLPEMNYAPPPPLPLTDSEVALVRRAITGSTQGKSRGGSSGGSKGGTAARKPKPRPEKKRPITVETPPYSMTAAEFARQGQAYLRGKPYTATPALPSARSK